MNYLQLIIKRLKSESPDFYKKLRNISLMLAIPMGMVAFINEEFPSLIPEGDIYKLIVKLCQIFSALFFGVSLTSSTTTKNPSLLGDDTKEAVIKSTNSVEQL
jgi:hypothetical protein